MRRYALSLGLKSLKQHLRRNIIAGTAMGIGYIAMLFVMGYKVHLNRYLTATTIYLQNSGHVAVYNKGGLRGTSINPRKFSLAPQTVEAVMAFMSKRPDFEFAAPYLLGSGLLGNGCKSYPFVGRGTLPSVEERIARHPEVLYVLPDFKAVNGGQPLWVANDIYQVSLAEGLSKRAGKSLRGESSDELSLITPEDCDSPRAAELIRKDSSVQLLTRTFDRRNGALDADFSSHYSTGMATTNDVGLTAPLAFMQELLDTESITYLAIFLKDEKATQSVLQSLQAEMKAKGIDIDAYAWDDKRLNPSYVYGQSVAMVTVYFASAIVVIVVLLSILNTLSIGLVESRREIGTLLAIGYNPNEIAWIFTFETLASSFIAMVFGAFGTYAVCSFAAFLEIPMKVPGLAQATTFQFTPTPTQYVYVAIGICILAIATTFVIARRFASRDILTLLDQGV